MLQYESFLETTVVRELNGKVTLPLPSAINCNSLFYRANLYAEYVADISSMKEGDTILVSPYEHGQIPRVPIKVNKSCKCLWFPKTSPQNILKMDESSYNVFRCKEIIVATKVFTRAAKRDYPLYRFEFAHPFSIDEMDNICKKFPDVNLELSWIHEYDCLAYRKVMPDA